MAEAFLDLLSRVGRQSGDDGGHGLHRTRTADRRVRRRPKTGADRRWHESQPCQTLSPLSVPVAVFVFCVKYEYSSTLADDETLGLGLNLSRTFSTITR